MVTFPEKFSIKAMWLVKVLQFLKFLAIPKNENLVIYFTQGVQF